MAFCTSEEVLREHAVRQFKRPKRGSDSVFSFQVGVFLSCSNLKKGVPGQVSNRHSSAMLFCSETQRLLHTVSTAGRRCSGASFTRCILQVVIIKIKAELIKGRVAAPNVAVIIKYSEKKQPRIEGVYFWLTVPVTVHPGKEVTRQELG